MERLSPSTKTNLDRLENLPDPAVKTIYIVSSIVAQAVSDRTDVMIPDDPVRDEAGRIIGARGLARV